MRTRSLFGTALASLIGQSIVQSTSKSKKVCPFSRKNVVGFYSIEIGLGNIETNDCTAAEKAGIASLLEYGMSLYIPNVAKGVIQSHNKICPTPLSSDILKKKAGNNQYSYFAEGEYLGNSTNDDDDCVFDDTEDDDDEDDEDEERRALGRRRHKRRHKRKKTKFKFEYTGGGRCRICPRDDEDDRRALLQANNNTSMNIATKPKQGDFIDDKKSVQDLIRNLFRRGSSGRNGRGGRVVRVPVMRFVARPRRPIRPLRGNKPSIQVGSGGRGKRGGRVRMPRRRSVARPRRLNRPRKSYSQNDGGGRGRSFGPIERGGRFVIVPERRFKRRGRLVILGRFGIIQEGQFGKRGRVGKGHLRRPRHPLEMMAVKNKKNKTMARTGLTLTRLRPTMMKRRRKKTSTKIKRRRMTMAMKMKKNIPQKKGKAGTYPAASQGQSTRQKTIDQFVRQFKSIETFLNSKLSKLLIASYRNESDHCLCYETPTVHVGLVYETNWNNNMWEQVCQV